jgi:bifunctional non-homologous end joining protein LigD
VSAALAQAPRAALPPRFEPMKAVLVDTPFSDPGWIFERKLDGIRCGARRAGGAVRLLSRSGQELGPSYPELVDALARDGPDLLADGEIVAFAGSATSFARLQRRMQIHDPERARATGVKVILYVFDLLHLDGRDLTGLPLRDRKAFLRGAVPSGAGVRFTTHRNGDGEEAYRYACAHGWEGVIAKRADSPYRATRSRDWRKLKCNREQELVIGGWTEPKGSRQELGAILVGYYEDGRLRYAGKVGTGFDEAMLRRLGAELRRRERDRPPFADAEGLPRAARWAEPELVGQVGFAEWTRDGRLRHPRFLGLRDDKPAREVVREVPA